MPSEGKLPEIKISAVSDAYDQNDGRWTDQVSEFHHDLHRRVGTIRQELAPKEGQKGGAASFFLELATGGALTAAADMFKAWLASDRSRSLELSYERGGETRSIRVSGKGFSETDIKEFLEGAWHKVEDER